MIREEEVVPDICDRKVTAFPNQNQVKSVARHMGWTYNKLMQRQCIQHIQESDCAWFRAAIDLNIKVTQKYASI